MNCVRDFVVAAVLAALAGGLAACSDPTPTPVYNYGQASGTPCGNCNGTWHRWHDGQWHVD